MKRIHYAFLDFYFAKLSQDPGPSQPVQARGPGIGEEDGYNKQTLSKKIVA